MSTHELKNSFVSKQSVPRSFSLAIKLLALSVLILQGTSFPDAALARGGGGGGGGGRGGGFGGFGGRGFSGDGFGRGDLGADRGFGGEGWGNGGFADRGSGGRDDGFNNRPPVSESALRQGANQDYHWGNLPTDGGLSRGMNGLAGANAASRITNHVSEADLATRGYGVRNAFRHYDLFDRDFWARNRDAWWYDGWGDGWCWGYTDWDDLSSYWGDPYAAAPVEYDYGNNITYQDNSVYYGDQPMESAEAYYTQAQVLANSVPPTIPPSVPAAATKGTTKSGAKPAAKTPPGKASDWKPLGVFALTQGDQTDSNSIFQLAVNKTGVIRGNYFNPLTSEEKPVQGKVDMKNKRVAWTVGSNKNVVYDTGLANLLAKQSSLLIHMDKNTTQQWNLVRLQKDKSST
jgi:hypothetical protein